jgi:hypothetical protein
MKYTLYELKLISGIAHIQETIADTNQPNVKCAITYKELKIKPTPSFLVFEVNGYFGKIKLNKPFSFNETEKDNFFTIEKKVLNKIRKHKLKLLEENYGN